MSTQAAKSSEAKGLTYWRKELLKVSLPALADTGAFLKQKLADPDVSLIELEHIIAEDPVLSFQLLSKASKARTNLENDLLSLPHALSLLGLNKVKPILSTVKYIRFDPAKTAHNAFLQALNTSLHAATQAYQIAEQKEQGTGEASYWIALRLSSVFWLLSLASPKIYHAIEKRVQLGESRHRVELELMGCTTQQLIRAMLKDWHLSTFTQSNLNKLLNASPQMLAKTAQCAWQEGFAPEVPKAQGHFLQTPYSISVLAHWLSLNSAVNWFTPKTSRIERMIAVYLHRPVNEVTPFLHQNAVLCSKSHQLAGVWLPAIKLLHPPLEKRSVIHRQKAEQLNPKSRTQSKTAAQLKATSEAKPLAKTSAASKSPTPKAKNTGTPRGAPKASADITAKSADTHTQIKGIDSVQTALFKLFYLQTVKEKQVFSIHQMMDGASQVLHFDLGLTRCILFMKSRSQGSVKGVYAKGFIDNTPFAHMTLDADSRHLFGKLLNKQAALWVKPENKARYLSELPPGFWQHLDSPEEFVLSSITLRGKVSGILYADTKGGSKKLTDSYYSAFRALAQAISHGMGTLAEQKEREHLKQPPLT